MNCTKMNSTKKTLALVSTSALAAGAAQGAVLYTPIDITIAPHAKMTLDLNQDATPDFLMQFLDSKPARPSIDNSLNGSAYVLAGANLGLPAR